MIDRVAHSQSQSFDLLCKTKYQWRVYLAKMVVWYATASTKCLTNLCSLGEISIDPQDQMCKEGP